MDNKDSGKKKLEVNVGGQPVSAEQADRVREQLRRTLIDQVKKEVPGAAAGNEAAGDVSSHARW